MKNKIESCSKKDSLLYRKKVMEIRYDKKTCANKLISLKIVSNIKHHLFLSN